MPKRVANVTSRHSTMMQGGGGLPTGFHGVIEAMGPVVWSQPKRGGGTFDPVTALRMKVRPDEDQPDDAVLPEKILNENDGLVVQYYKASKLSDFVPSTDNEEPVDLEAADEDETAGSYLIPTDNLWDRFERAGHDSSKESPQLNNSTVWAEFVEKAEAAGVPDEVLDSNDYSSWVGLHLRFDRVPQKDRPGLVQEPGPDGQVRKNMLLAITEVLEDEKPKGKGKTAAAAKGKTAPTAVKGKVAAKGAAKADENGVEELVLTALASYIKKKGKPGEIDGEEYEHTVDRDSLHTPAIQAVSPKQKKQALELVSSDKLYANSDNLLFDEESNLVALLEG